VKDTLQTRKGIEMYISKRIEVSWTSEEEKKINDFRRFLQDTAEKVEDALPSLYEELHVIDISLYDILYSNFDEDIDLDTKEDK
jgi:hypothetical protein